MVTNMKTYSFIKNLVFIIISLAAGLIFTYFVYYSSNSDATKQYTTNLSSNWTINSNTSFIDLPISVPLAIGDTLTLSTIIPDNISSEYNTLCLPTYYFNVEVFLNETLIYQNEPKFAPLLSTNGTDLILIPLQDSFRNQMLTIKIVPQLNITKYKIDSPFLCNKGDYFD